MAINKCVANQPFPKHCKIQYNVTNSRKTNMQNQIFTASRFTAGNFFFPVRIEINQERVTRVKPKVFGSNEESIAISKVASVNIETGLVWSTIRIDSEGGSNPILSRGHAKDDARSIRDLIEQFQKK